MAEKDTDHRLALIGMPAWDPGKPFHALALVAGMARDAGVAVTPFDINIDFYHEVDDQEKEFWGESHNRFWFEEKLPKSLWKKYKKWFGARLDAIIATKPTLIAFSVNMSTRFLSIYAAKHLKKRLPQAPILFGGVDCFPGEGKRDLFLRPARKHFCDIICQGESEIAFPKLLAEFTRTGSIKTAIPGFAYYDGRELVDTGDTELPSLQGDLPLPAYDLFDLSKYTVKGSLPFFLTRGCVYRCNFCSERPNFRSFRARSAAEAVGELQAVLPYAKKFVEVPTLSLADSNLNASPKMLKEFVELIIDKGIKIKWGGQAHFQRQLTREVLEQMAQAGFVSVFWGMETGSQRVVDLMNKAYDQAEARRILRDCNELGIRQVLPIIIGYPGETPEDVVDTIDLILEYKDWPTCKINMPALLVVRPNSPLYDNWQEHGLANKLLYQWSTEDGSNTLPVRIARRFIARQAWGNPELSRDALVDTEEILNIQINESIVGVDVFGVLYELFSRSGGLEEFYATIEDWSGVRGACSGGDDGARKARAQQAWLELNKDGEAGRARLYETILTALRSYKAAVDARRPTAQSA